MNNEIDWQKNLKDSMWSMFWLGADKQHIEIDKELMRENVARLIAMTTQKIAGRRKSKNQISWDSLEVTIMNILCAATSLALAGVFGEMPETIEGDPQDD